MYNDYENKILVKDIDISRDFNAKEALNKLASSIKMTSNSILTQSFFSPNLIQLQYQI